MDFLIRSRFCAPIYFPTSDSPAYAKPSITYENSVKNCISSVFAERKSSPIRAPAAGMNVKTAIRQSVRRKMSAFTLKNAIIFSLEQTAFHEKKRRSER